MSRRLLLCELLLLPLPLAALAWYVSVWCLLLLPVLAGVLAWSIRSQHCSWWGKVLSEFPTRGREVLLTFHGTPHGHEVQEVLTVLKQYGTRGLFFFPGNYVQRHPEDVLSTLSAGQPLGCTTWETAPQRYWRLPPAQLLAELSHSVTALRRLMPEQMELRWYAAPGNLHHPLQQDALVQLQLERMGFTVADDGARVDDPDALLARLQAGIKPGAILRLSFGQRDAAGAPVLPWLLEELLLWLRGQGYAMG